MKEANVAGGDHLNPPSGGDPTIDGHLNPPLKGGILMLMSTSTVILGNTPIILVDTHNRYQDHWNP